MDDPEFDMTDFINSVPPSTSNFSSTTRELDDHEKISANLQPQYLNLDGPSSNNKHSINCSDKPEANNNQTNEIFYILSSWNLQQLFSTLQRNEIDVETLNSMKDHHIKELLKGESLGTRIKFTEHLNKWQNSQSQQIFTKVWSNFDSTNAEPQATSSIPDKLIVLKDILKQTNPGKYLLGISKNNIDLSDASRSILIDEIVTYYINNNILMGVTQCDEMSNQIERYFQKETASVYFQRRQKMKSKGHLYDRYNNRISKLRSSSLIPKCKRYKRSEESLIQNDLNVSNTIDDETALELCQNLKYNRDDNNLEDILSKRTSSAKYRLKCIKYVKDKNINAKIHEWPAYAQSYGPRLIDIDFVEMYPNSGNIFLQFDRFCNDIISIMDTRIVEPLSKKMYNEYKQQKNVSPEARSCVIMLLLHALIKPSTKKKTLNNQYLKFTIKDAQNSFLILLPTTQDVDRHIEFQKNLKSKIQPFLFVIGENMYTKNQYFVYCDSIKYRCLSPLTALDCAFKLFQVFDLEYPPQSKAVWQFIQKFFYNIETKYDDAFLAVSLLINKLKNN